MYEVKLKISFQDNKCSEKISLAFEEKEVYVFQKYLENCKRLKKAEIFKNDFPSIEKIQWKEETGLQLEVTEFSDSHVCELLHLARPIFLAKEPASFEKTQGIIGKIAKNTLLIRQLKYLRNLYEKGTYQPYFQITIGDTPIFSDETIKLWLNGVEYHQDSEKSQIIEELYKDLSEKTVRGIFVSDLSGKILAIYSLADLVENLLKRKQIKPAAN